MRLETALRLLAKTDREVLNELVTRLWLRDQAAAARVEAVLAHIDAVGGFEAFGELLAELRECELAVLDA